MLQDDKDIRGSSPPSSDLAMLADLADSIANGTKLHLQGREDVSQKKIPLTDTTACNNFVNTSEAEITVKRDEKGNCRKLSIITTPPRRHSTEREREDHLTATGPPFTTPATDAGPHLIQFKTLICKDKDINKAPVRRHFITPQHRHSVTNNGLRVSSKQRALPFQLVNISGGIPLFERSAPRNGRDISNHSHRIPVKALPLSAAIRLAKLCSEGNNIHSNGRKGLLWSSNSKRTFSSGSARTQKGGLAQPLPVISKHLKKRRARADSYSSSSSSASDSILGTPPSQKRRKLVLSSPFEFQGRVTMMANDFGSPYIATPTVSGIAESLANSLCIETPSCLYSSEGSKRITSPSTGSVDSSHSIFSVQSYASMATTNAPSSHHHDDHEDEDMQRTSRRHPSAQAHRVLHLYEHSPESTPKKRIHIPPKPLTSMQPLHSVMRDGMCPPFDHPHSRYFSRRNAIAPLADVDSNRKVGSSGIGPMRTSKSLKSARVYHGASLLTVPRAHRPRSPAPAKSAKGSEIPYLFVPPRRLSMPPLHIQLGSPMKLAAPKPILPKAYYLHASILSRNHVEENDDQMSSDDGLDFCCKGSESPLVSQSSTPYHMKQIFMYTPYQRSSSVSSRVSQLSARRGKSVASLKLR